jgi:adenylate cyclase
MPDLIAQGTEPDCRWRRKLPPDQTCILGRDAGFWSTSWDRQISRRHVEICWREDRLEVRRLPSARNPVFVRGRSQDFFVLYPGEHFVIGDTTFVLADECAQVSLGAPPPVTQETFSAQYLKGLRFRNSDQRINVLSRIPEIISSAVSDEEMFVRLTSVLLSGIAHGIATALVEVDLVDRTAPVKVLHWDRRHHGENEFQPSESLIRQAVELGESVVHIWDDTKRDPDDAANPDGDWAFCTPVGGATCRGWAIYVAGVFSIEPNVSGTLGVEVLQDDLKYTELVATTLRSLREVRLLERSQANLRQFLSPVVVDALAGHDPDEVLAPRETQVSVIFCDLRGFAAQSERSADDLLGLLERVSDALGVTTRHILQQSGVVGDFHGDAAMGFWGWPLSQPDSVQRACRAALGIRAEFLAASRQENHPLSDFRMGIGIATGRAVAGKIGTVDQVKVTVFGPVVNLAARLEGMTKVLRAPILLDEVSAAAARSTMSADQARLRRVAVVQPYGIETSLEVSELLPPQSEYPQMTDQDIQAYEAALEALLDRQWQKAFELLHRVTTEDRVKDFLTVFIAQHNRTPPSQWNGVIPLLTK